MVRSGGVSGRTQRGIRGMVGDMGEGHRFTGQEADGETGLYYYGARYYDPTMGRFVGVDPLVLGQAEKTRIDFSASLVVPSQLKLRECLQ